MDNTPTAEADQLDGTVRHSPISGLTIFGHAMRVMYGSISRAASTCAVSGSGRHHFSGYPRSKSIC